MQTQDKITSEGVDNHQLQEVISKAQNYLLSIQYPDGYWWAELESNVTMTAEAVLLHKIWGTDKSRPLHKAEAYLRSQQREHGGWELFYNDGGHLCTSIESYMALRLLGVPQNDPALLKAKDFIIQRGGISKSRIFTKLHLALIGCYDWKGIPSIPAWIMLLPDNFPFTIYEFSSWARGSTVPLLIVFDRKPIFTLDTPITLDELYAEGKANANYALPQHHDWTDLFLYLDKFFKFSESLNLVPFREEGLKKAEQWVLERQEDTGDWGGIIPAMLNSLIALRCLNYSVTDPVVDRGLKAVDNFAIETDTHYRMQACISPVWDTAWAIRALTATGLNPDHPALVKGADWLIDKQILDYGDWAVKNKEGKPACWAFEFDNRWYPDLDDSAVVVMALDKVNMPNNARKQSAMQRCMKWMETMQCKAGGWAAFDLDNDQEWLNALPYADLKAMIDPNTADVTARVLEMVGAVKGDFDRNRLIRGLIYLAQEQETDGSWFGRWGVNYIYGTSGVLSALGVLVEDYEGINNLSLKSMILKGVKWLISCQNSDGGWGETCQSYRDVSLKGKGISTASQTAWALIGLLSVREYLDQKGHLAVDKGANYLLKTQLPDGRWDEDSFTGTGFPCHFYLKYHLYQQYFPMIALGMFSQPFTGVHA